MTLEECYEYFWKIPDFLNRKEEENEFIGSPEFTILDSNGKLAKFQIYLNPNGYEKSKYVSVFLNSLVEISTYRLSILGTENEYEISTSKILAQGSWRWLKLIDTDDLERNHDNFLPDGTLTLVLKTSKRGWL